MYDRLLFILFLKTEFYNLILSTFCNDHNFLPGFNITTDINNEFLIITCLVLCIEKLSVQIS